MYLNGNDMQWKEILGNEPRWNKGTQSVFSCDVI